MSEELMTIDKIIDNMWRDSGTSGDINFADDEDKRIEARAHLTRIMDRREIEVRLDELQRIGTGDGIVWVDDKPVQDHITQLKEELTK